MKPQPERRLTLEDLYELPGDGRRYELHRGHLVAEPGPGGRHGRIEARLTALLHNYASYRRSAIVLSNASFVLARDPDTIRVPDIAVVDRDRYLALEDEALPIPGPPAIAIEIVSPSNRPGELQRRVADYLRAGTGMVWVIDPARQSVEVHRPDSAPALRVGADELDGGGVLAGLCLRVVQLFHL